MATFCRLQRNDRAMMCWICNFNANDEVSSDSLLSKLGLQDIYVVFCSSKIRIRITSNGQYHTRGMGLDRRGKMRWYGHVERIKGFISQVRNLNVVVQNRSDKLRKSWDEMLLDD